VIRRFLDRIFGIDARSLAAFRVATGLILLVDLWIRSASIVEHYSDAGLLTRRQWVDSTALTWEWSLHAMNGQPAFARMLFAAAAVAGAMLVIGWRTRLAAFVSWLLLVSLQQRNEYLINGGDVLLRVLLFWAMFLPLGARWSLDALLSRASPTLMPPAPPLRVLSVATACIVIQFLLMYVCSGLYKFNEVWSSGDAMRRSLNVDMYVRTLGIAMRSNEGLLTVVSRAVPWIEVVLPALCLLPVLTDWWRGLAIVVFAALHLSIEFTLTTGLFSWVCLAGWLLLVPSGWWDVLPRRRRGEQYKEHHPGRVVLPDDVGDGRTRPVGEVEPKQHHPVGMVLPAVPRSPMRHLGDGLLLFLLAYVVVWNISGLRDYFTREPLLKESQHWLAELTGLKQKWDMFTDPPRDNGWYIVIGTTVSGKTVDVLTGGDVDGQEEQPTGAIYDRYIDHRWRKHMASAATDAYRGHRSRVALALAQRWNRLHGEGEQLDWIEVVFMRQTTPMPGEPATAARRFVMHKGPVEREP